MVTVLFIIFIGEHDYFCYCYYDKPHDNITVIMICSSSSLYRRHDFVINIFKTVLVWFVSSQI